MHNLKVAIVRYLGKFTEREDFPEIPDYEKFLRAIKEATPSSHFIIVDNDNYSQ
jgi:hypothetical protein